MAWPSLMSSPPAHRTCRTSPRRGARCGGGHPSMPGRALAGLPRHAAAVVPAGCVCHAAMGCDWGGWRCGGVCSLACSAETAPSDFPPGRGLPVLCMPGLAATACGLGAPRPGTDWALAGAGCRANGCGGPNRTGDMQVMSLLIYQLIYAAKEKPAEACTWRAIWLQTARFELATFGL